MDSESIIMLSLPESEFPFEFRRPILVPVPDSSGSVPVPVPVPDGDLIIGCGDDFTLVSSGVTGGVGEEDDRDSNCCRSDWTPDWEEGGRLVLLLWRSSTFRLSGGDNSLAPLPSVEVSSRSCDLACSKGWCLFLILTWWGFPLSLPVPSLEHFSRLGNRLSLMKSSIFVTRPSAVKLSFLDTAGGELECLTLILVWTAPPLENSNFFFFLAWVEIDESLATWSRPEYKNTKEWITDYYRNGTCKPRNEYHTCCKIHTTKHYSIIVSCQLKTDNIIYVCD